MSPYEYFMVTLSIVLGLALGNLLTRAFGLVHQRGTLRFHWVPALWAFGIFAWIVQFCYVGFVINDFDAWSLSIFLVMLAALIALFGAAELILPATGDGAPDLLAHFHGTGRVALACFALYFAFSVPINHYVIAEVPEHREAAAEEAARVVAEAEAARAADQDFHRELHPPTPRVRELVVSEIQAPPGNPERVLHEHRVRSADYEEYARQTPKSRYLLISESTAPLRVDEIAAGLAYPQQQPMLLLAPEMPTPWWQSLGRALFGWSEGTSLPAAGVALISLGMFTRGPAARGGAALLFAAFTLAEYARILRIEL